MFSAAFLVLHRPPLAIAQTVTYDPSAEFSITNGNPNGVWSYGWMPVGFGTLHLLTNATTGTAGSPGWAGWNFDWAPLIWKNLGPPVLGIPTGWLALHPGPGQEPIVLRWTASAASSVRLDGQFLPGDFGAMQVAVRLNGQPWWSASDSGSFSLQTNVVAGTTIDFTVYGGYGAGNTPLTVMISTIPPLHLHVARDGTNNTVSFTAPGDGAYVLQFTDSLTPAIEWTDLSTNSLSAGQFFSFIHSPGESSGFYRCRRE